MYECDSWTIKKAEHQRTDAFELLFWRRLLRIPWTAKRFNQSILKEISPEYSLERLMLEVGIPILWPPDVKNWHTGKDPDTGKDWRQEEKGTTEDEIVGWYHRLNRHEFEHALRVGDEQGSLECCGPWVTKSWTRLSDWTDRPTDDAISLNQDYQDWMGESSRKNIKGIKDIYRNACMQAQ